MVPEKQSLISSQLMKLILIAFFSSSLSTYALAGEPTYVKLPESKPFVFSAGFGYGISNNPVRNKEQSKSIGGATFSVSIGYNFSEKFKLEFGPAFWVQGSDLINKNVADSERPNNKRTFITFTGSYKPFRHAPLSIKLGAGAGSLIYTPEKKTVSSDEYKYKQTEIFKGFVGSFGLSYELSLCNKIKMHPSINLLYLQMETPKLDYNSYIEYHQASITADLRVHFNYIF